MAFRVLTLTNAAERSNERAGICAQSFPRTVSALLAPCCELSELAHERSRALISAQIMYTWVLNGALGKPSQIAWELDKSNIQMVILILKPRVPFV